MSTLPTPNKYSEIQVHKLSQSKYDELKKENHEFAENAIVLIKPEDKANQSDFIALEQRVTELDKEKGRVELIEGRLNTIESVIEPLTGGNLTFSSTIVGDNTIITFS